LSACVAALGFGYCTENRAFSFCEILDDGVVLCRNSAANAKRTLEKRAPGDSSGSLQFSIWL